VPAGAAGGVPRESWLAGRAAGRGRPALARPGGGRRAAWVSRSWRGGGPGWCVRAPAAGPLGVAAARRRGPWPGAGVGCHRRGCLAGRGPRGGAGPVSLAGPGRASAGCASSAPCPRGPGARAGSPAGGGPVPRPGPCSSGPVSLWGTGRLTSRSGELGSIPIGERMAAREPGPRSAARWGRDGSSPPATRAVKSLLDKHSGSGLGQFCT